MPLTPYLFQLFGVGILWVSFHCVGMCGPIVASLNTAVSKDGSKWQRVRQGAGNILAYQAGRAVTYVILGALAGWIGASVEGAIQGVTKIAGLLTAVALVGAGVWQLPPVHAALLGGSDGQGNSQGGGGAGRIGRFGTALGAAARRITRLFPHTGRLRLTAFGAVMGLLPCMLMFWVLGLAASTAHPLQGALVMLGLIVMTTPVLIFAGTSPLLAGGFWRRHGEWVTAGAVIISGLWLGVIAAAANGWIEHFHIVFDWGGEGYTIMLW